MFSATSVPMKGKVAIVGSGHIGSSWATLFISNGYSVSLFDISDQQLNKSREIISDNLDKLEEKGLLKASKSECLQLISSTTCLTEAVNSAIYVQESACESLEYKIKIFEELDELSSPDCILASSTSTIPASKFTENLKHRERCLVAHPVNPPLFLKLVEIVSTPWTSEEIVKKCRRLMQDIGQDPVNLTKEVLGFAVNRLQFALLAEAWRLVKDDVMSVEDVDKVMKAGLGPRYAFYGPFETIHMNANGIDDYCQRYTAGIQNVMADFGRNPSFEEEDVLEKLKQSLYATAPTETLENLKKEREDNLAALMRIKNSNCK